ncbi:MAG: SLC13 family permease [Rhodobacterales bacterium]|nr:SLC13 family permease [Rhodobacterales bacterium]
MSDIWIVFTIIAGIVGLFMWDRFPVIAVCMAAALALWATGILTLQQSLAGFGDPAVIFIAALFVVSAGLEMSGVTVWAGQQLIQQAGESRTRLIVMMMLMVGVLSALISVNGAVAALLPVVVVMAIRLDRSPAKLLMPLVFGAHAGSQIMLTGSPVNVLVSEASYDAGAGGFAYFEFAWVGVPALAGCIAIVVFFGEKLLPNRRSKTLPPDLSQHAKTLVGQYNLESDVHQLRVPEGSPLAGTARRALDFSARPGVILVARQGADERPVKREQIAADDVIVVRGDLAAVEALAEDLGLEVLDRQSFASGGIALSLFNKGSGLAEVLIPPRSPLVGERFFPGMVTESGDLIVLAMQRQGTDLEAGDHLQVGDTLLLQGTWTALDQRLEGSEVLVVNSPAQVRKQAVAMGTGARLMIAILLGMVLLLATGIVPPAVAGLLAAGGVLLGGILSVEQVYRSINWTTVILVGAMMPLSKAMEVTGAARLLAEGLVTMVGDGGGYALLTGLFILTAILGQVISNTATALIIIPVAVVAAQQMGLSPQPVLMSVGVAAAGAFLTPVATATNLMVMEPGGYRFGDYWKLGLPMLIWFYVISVFLVPVIWPF